MQYFYKVDGDDVILTETTASTVALIVNELVQNSLKYAFKDRKQGQIRLKIEKGASYSWITVQDDGCGFDNKRFPGKQRTGAPPDQQSGTIKPERRIVYRNRGKWNQYKIFFFHAPGWII